MYAFWMPVTKSWELFQDQLLACFEDVDDVIAFAIANTSFLAMTLRMLLISSKIVQWA